MKISDKGLALIQKYEGCRLTAYLCPAGVLTIGYGHTGKDVKPGMTITKTRALELLKKDVSKFEKAVLKYDSIYKWNQNQFDALVSFAFNIGSIDQLTNNGKRTISEISSKIPAYNKANGKVLSGLTKRRLEEKNLFDSKSSSASSTTTTTNVTTEPIKQEVSVKLPIIKKGSVGKSVKVWQSIIGVSIDGDFGSKTESATRKFQKNHNLTQDGVVGCNTWTSGLESI